MEAWGELFATGEAWYRGAPFEVVQLIYPDRNGFLPYEPGYEHRMRLAQPVIGRRSSEAVTVRFDVACPIAMLLRSAAHFEWPGRPGPATWVNAPRCLRRPDEGGMWPDPSGNEAFRPLAMRETRRDRRTSTMTPDTSDRRQRRVTGAWVPGDPPGHRQFFTFATDRRFALDGGVRAVRRRAGVRDVGHASTPPASNAVLLCHAWTGDSHVTGPAGTGHPEPGWWEGMVGPGKPIDTEPLVRRVLERARRLPGLDRAGVAAPRRRAPVRARGSR